MNAVQFVSRSTKIAVSGSADSTSTCPFQVDLCIAMGPPIEVEAKDDSDDDGDDGDGDDTDGDDTEEVKAEYVDYVGDIAAKLSANDLEFKKMQCGVNSTAQNDGIVERRKLFTFHTETESLHRQRLIAFVDRRRKGDTEDVFVYNPPADSRDIPKDAVPEWYIASSMTTMLPDMSYGDGAPGHESKDQNIGAAFDCGGSLLTLSIHAKQQDLIKAYLYWNGKMMRFMPEDIKTVFPLIFNMDYKGNREFMKMEVLDGYVDDLKAALIDRDFASFSRQHQE